MADTVIERSEMEPGAWRRGAHGPPGALRYGLTWGLLLAGLTGACGHDEPLAKRPGADDAGRPTPDAGAPQDATTPRADGAAPSAQPSVPQVQCGGQRCRAPDLDVAALLGDASSLPVPPGLLGGFTAGLLHPCCIEPDRTCGVQSAILFGEAGCVDARQAGTTDPSCPGLDATVEVLTLSLPLTLPGCCRTADAACGFDLGVLGAGCLVLPAGDDAGADREGACAAELDGDAGGVP